MKIRYLLLSVLVLIISSIISAEVKTRYIKLDPGESVNLDNIIVQCDVSKIDKAEKIDKKLERKKINLERKIAEYKKNGDRLAKFCMKISFKKEREECSAIKVTYIEDGAVRICEKMSFDKAKLDCIKAVVDKVYSDSELTLASQASFEKDRIASLDKSGININDLQDRK